MNLVEKHCKVSRLEIANLFLAADAIKSLGVFTSSALDPRMSHIKYLFSIIPIEVDIIEVWFGYEKTTPFSFFINGIEVSATYIPSEIGNIIHYKGQAIVLKKGEVFKF